VWQPQAQDSSEAESKLGDGWVCHTWLSTFCTGMTREQSTRMTTGTVVDTNKHIFCKLHYKKVCAPINLPALSQIYSGLNSVSILGANSSKKNADRFSYFAAEPKEVFEFKIGQKDPFEKLSKLLNKYKLDEPRGNHPGLPLHGIFCGGWIGYFSYELGRYIEHLPETTIDDLEMPLIRLCFYDRVIAYDHITKTCWLIALQLQADIEEPEDKLASLEMLIAESQKIHIESRFVEVPADFSNINFSQIHCNMDKDYYLQAVDKIKRYIYDGDIYQVNFSQRFECDYNTRPIDLFHWQNHYNPSPYAAYIDGGSFHIVSASPEMFITIIDNIISTKPIKGTRPRVIETCEAEKQTNARNFEQLCYSEKEQAELNMIVDLERNDIAKICEPGTRRVVQPRTIESYPTVFHALATVAGQLRKGTTFCDILKAMFPGGSITGAPKIRSMEIIDETEPTVRAVYTGSIGFISIDGSVCLNIVIRTIIIKGDKAYAQTGGGIVADSSPEAEWQETITKARALIAGIKATQKAAYV